MVGDDSQTNNIHKNSEQHFMAIHQFFCGCMPNHILLLNKERKEHLKHIKQVLGTLR